MSEENGSIPSFTTDDTLVYLRNASFAKFFDLLKELKFIYKQVRADGGCLGS